MVPVGGLFLVKDASFGSRPRAKEGEYNVVLMKRLSSGISGVAELGVKMQPAGQTDVTTFHLVYTHGELNAAIAGGSVVPVPVEAYDSNSVLGRLTPLSDLPADIQPIAYYGVKYAEAYKSQYRFQQAAEAAAEAEAAAAGAGAGHPVVPLTPEESEILSWGFNS